jgi:hypothetical protein
MNNAQIDSQLTLSSVLASWEDEDGNRHYPLNDGTVAVRDGGNGRWRGILIPRPSVTNLAGVVPNEQ